jgi:hypothetical protein
MNTDIMNSFMKNLDWEAIDTKLMLRHDPNTRVARRKFFASCDDSGGGSLDVAELKAGVLRLLVDSKGQSLVPMGDELLPAVRCAFNASRNLEKSGKKKGKQYKVASGKKAKVGAPEFHAFLTAFKYYLQLLEMFEFLDGQGEDNQKLSLRECKRGIFLLNGWGITEEELDEKFAGVDAWVSHLSFKDFAMWCIEECGILASLELDNSDNEEVDQAKSRHAMQKEHGIEMRSDGHGMIARDSEENLETVKQLFHKWDEDGSGSICADELKKVLLSLDPNMSEEKTDKLFVAADKNKDGRLDLDEFLKWIMA